MKKISLLLALSLLLVILGFYRQTANQSLQSQAAGLASPRRLTIPKLRISSEVEELGLDKKGNMDVPKNFQDVGWYKLGYRLGENGNMVITGHLDTPTGPAVFSELNLLTLGDEIFVDGSDSRQFVYKVYDKQIFGYSEFPLNLVFGPSAEQSLNLITCSGVFDRQNKNYSNRLVIFSKLRKVRPNQPVRQLSGWATPGELHRSVSEAQYFGQ